MTTEYWKRVWEQQNIGFHRKRPNPQLLTHFHQLDLKRGARIFLPLCGKTLDIAWLLSQGYQVVGVEVSELAIQALFQNLEVNPTISRSKDLTVYQTSDLDIICGDIFHVGREQLGPVDAVFDRAALVALPEDMRKHYTEHIIQITNAATQLVITFDYDETLKVGPPFSISPAEMEVHYQTDYSIKRLERMVVQGGLKGSIPAHEDVWLLDPEPEA